MFPVVSGNSSKADLCLTLPGSQAMSDNVSPSSLVALSTLYSKTVYLLATDSHLFLGASRKKL